MKKTTAFRNLLKGPGTSFIMEAHNGISAKIVEEAGFKGIWGSGLTISSSLGVRDNNEASWTQVLEVVEFMSDATTIPLLLDGDTGYGNFNNMRRLVRKLEQRGVGGVCIEDKLFPKTNSFINGEAQPLADVDEFCGKIKAGKDSQSDGDFCIVARVEALIAGWSLGEALRRAEAYHKAGADAILIHSKKSKADEILAFKKEWGNRLPIVIVPTKYYSTPTKAFEDAGINLIIWANHLMRAAVTTMQKTAAEIYSKRSLITVEDHVASVNELFRLQGADELEAAEEAYLPKTSNPYSAIILAASRGKELGNITAEIPKAMIPVGGKPMLESQIQVFNNMGIKGVTVVRGYKKEAIRFVGPEYVDNDKYETTKELYSLSRAAEKISGNVIISYGDVLFRKFIPDTLLETKGDIAIVVDANWKESRNQGRYADLVACSEPYRMELLEQNVTAKAFHEAPDPAVSGEWIGLMKLTAKGSTLFRDELAFLSKEEGFKDFHIVKLLNSLLKKGVAIEVLYIAGNWIDIDSIEDLSVAREF